MHGFREGDVAGYNPVGLDLQALRRSTSIAEVLTHCGVTHLRPYGPHGLTGACPIHRGDNPTAFRVDLRRNLWHCFTRCGGGNAMELLARLEHTTIYQAGLTLQRRQNPVETVVAPPSPKPFDAPGCAPELRFRLPLTPHPYLTEERGLRTDTCDHFGLGFCNRGIMRDTIAIPIHDHTGRLVAYAGRRLVVPPGEGKYRFPYAFQKSHVLFNAWRIPPHCQDIVVVEGFFDVFHLYECGLPNAVALMGSSIGQPQLQWLLDQSKPVSILLDGDGAGSKGQATLVRLLARHGHPHRAHRLDSGLQPEDLTPAYLQGLLVAPTPSSF